MKKTRLSINTAFVKNVNTVHVQIQIVLNKYYAECYLKTADRINSSPVCRLKHRTRLRFDRVMSSSSLTRESSGTNYP